MDNVGSGATTLRSCLKATKVRNIDGTGIGKYGNPMKPIRHIKIVKEKGDADAQNVSLDAVGNITREDEVVTHVTLNPNDIHADAWADPNVSAMGHTMARMSVEYEWKPPRCSDCLVFGHATEQCPKRVKAIPHASVRHSNEKSTTIDGDGFTTVVNRKSKGKGAIVWQKKSVGGFKINNAKSFIYQPVKPKENASKPSSSGTQAGKERSGVSNINDGISCLQNDDSNSEVEEVVFRSWDWTLNASICAKGCRIIIGWNKDVVDVMVVAQSDQAIHAKVFHKADNHIIFCSFVYAGNKPKERRVLWADLDKHKLVARGFPWVLMRDFNVAFFGKGNIPGKLYYTKKYNEVQWNMTV
uniref:RNA-directed DNA polymerase, eukaryota, reverse transcriptase zinc-binding domain protein n=1 Tax=Tanacetum cinerariifolium TaxID=118510 RepID=A0A699GGW6_TANCI|nr:RNA-directed DNA polymerase, eukaryota, reverse transcriptase zinc-binding domain protein [Tanacetum cinerariifolium]